MSQTNDILLFWLCYISLGACIECVSGKISAELQLLETSAGNVISFTILPDYKCRSLHFCHLDRPFV